MKLFKTIITPVSNFATPLKGDTLFGQICWAIRYKYSEQRLEKLLEDYETNPFLIVSDGFTKDYLPKPSMPSFLLNEDTNKKKENRKNIWLKMEDLQNGLYINAKNDKEKTVAIVKNSINYKTFTTDDTGTFAPYSEQESFLSSKDIYFLLGENFSKDELKETLNFVSQMGYGKNASIGKGMFTVSNFEEVKLNKKESNTFMALSPIVLGNQDIKDCYYEPFTRFGKHGVELHTNPFKKPILMANTGAAIILEKSCEKPYIGKAIKGHSSNSKTVHQGYSILIPIKEIDL